MFSTGGGADTVYQHVASDINTDQVQKDDETIPTVSCDYAYMSDSESRHDTDSGDSRPNNESIRCNSHLQDRRCSVCSSILCRVHP